MARLAVLAAVAVGVGWALIGCKDKGDAPDAVAVDEEPTRSPAVTRGAETEEAATPSRAQKLRAEMSAEELRTVREELAPMHSKNRWPAVAQGEYLASCEAAKKDDASINRRMCECTMEVVMNKFATAREYGQYLRDHEGQADDEELATMTGLCAAAYGDDAPASIDVAAPPAEAGAGAAAVAQGGQPGVSVGDPTITGSLAKDAVQKVAQSNLGQIRFCYEAALTKDPTLTGQVVVKVVISANGSVSKSQVAQKTVSSAELATCTAGRVSTWKFPRSAGVGTVTVTLPFEFQPPAR
ncbi:MAG: AgmX/PglI C-terminal domain-containing protein [Myxococcus sp.]|nr:AgmX/PglI C-terminal domain-containing protein [Myxococcus sp.]